MAPVLIVGAVWVVCVVEIYQQLPIALHLYLQVEASAVGLIAVSSIREGKKELVASLVLDYVQINHVALHIQ